MSAQRRWPPQEEGDWDIFTLDVWLEMNPGRYRPDAEFRCMLQHEHENPNPTATHVFVSGSSELTLKMCTAHMRTFLERWDPDNA